MAALAIFTKFTVMNIHVTGITGRVNPLEFVQFRDRYPAVALDTVGIAMAAGQGENRVIMIESQRIRQWNPVIRRMAGTTRQIRERLLLS
jgi:hypothetical protein